MAQIRHRAAELFSTFISTLVAASFIDDSLISLKISVNISEEVLRKIEFRKNRILVDLEYLDLIGYFECIAQSFRMLVEHIKHLFFAFKVLLLGVSETVGIVKICICGEADETVVRRSVLLANEMYVICSYDLRTCLCRQLVYAFIGYQLMLVNLLRLAGNQGLVLLDLEIEIISEHSLVPHHGLLCSFHVTCYDSLRDFSRNTGRTAHQVL